MTSWIDKATEVIDATTEAVSEAVDRVVDAISDPGQALTDMGITSGSFGGKGWTNAENTKGKENVEVDYSKVEKNADGTPSKTDHAYATHDDKVGQADNQDDIIKADRELAETLGRRLISTI